MNPPFWKSRPFWFGGLVVLPLLSARLKKKAVLPLSGPPPGMGWPVSGSVVGTRAKATVPRTLLWPFWFGSLGTQ